MPMRAEYQWFTLSRVRNVVCNISSLQGKYDNLFLGLLEIKAPVWRWILEKKSVTNGQHIIHHGRLFSRTDLVPLFGCADL